MKHLSPSYYTPTPSRSQTIERVLASESEKPTAESRIPADSNGGVGQNAARQRVLVCEDQRDAAETLAVLLQCEGHEVRVAHDGPSGIAQARQWRPTVVLIDIGLPGVSGYAVAQSIRALPGGADVLLIAITGYSTAADIEMARHAGFNWHFAKPAHPSFIAEVLKEPDRAPIHRRDGIPLTRGH